MLLTRSPLALALALAIVLAVALAGCRGAAGHPAPDDSSALTRGWEPFTELAPRCTGLYVPGPAAAPVRPIEWEDCPAPARACRRMRAFWRRAPGQSIAVFPRFGRDARTGRALLQFDRVYVDDRAAVRYRLVAEADGPVRAAVLQTGAMGRGCELVDQDVGEGRYVFGVVDAPGERAAGPDASDSPLEAALGGVLGATPSDSRPRVLARAPLDAALQSDWSVSAAWLVQRRGVREARSWDGAERHTAYDPARDPMQRPAHQTFARGRSVFVEVGTRTGWGVMVWDPARGTRPLLGDATRAAGALGTDGVAMVWTEARGANATTPLDALATRDVMTAPFATDADVLARTARRVAADPGGFSTQSYVVGCGYAARALSAGGASNDLLVVRLADGARWLLRGDPADPQRFGYTAALGLTCDELFATAVFRDRRVTIVRVRLAELGPPEPAP